MNNIKRYQVTTVDRDAGTIEVSDMVTPKDNEGARLRATYTLGDVSQFEEGDWVDIIIRKREG